MKGVIADCLRKMVIEKAGEATWSQIVRESGYGSDIILVSKDIDDAMVLKMLDNTCNKLNVSRQAGMDMFGEYWMMSYAPKVYSVFLNSAKTARELFLKLDNIHLSITRSMENARPPRLGYEWKSDKTLSITYNSSRNLIDLFVSLAKGVGKYYNEALIIKKVSPTVLEVTFAN